MRQFAFIGPDYKLQLGGEGEEMSRPSKGLGQVKPETGHEKQSQGGEKMINPQQEINCVTPLQDKGSTGKSSTVYQ